jgi:hypothetical protein
VRFERQVRGETMYLLANMVKTKSNGSRLLQYDRAWKSSAFDERVLFGCEKRV